MDDVLWEGYVDNPRPDCWGQVHVQVVDWGESIVVLSPDTPNGSGRLQQVHEKGLKLAAFEAAIRGILLQSMHERIALTLGWTVEETKSYSLAALRDLVRPVSAKLADEISREIHRGGHVVEQEP